MTMRLQGCFFIPAMKLVGGGGGGKPDFAQGGGGDPAKLPGAMEHALDLVKAAMAKK